MSKKENKSVLKEILGKLIAKGAKALKKLIKSKLLPRAEEKYCKALQVVTEKITNKIADKIANLNEETNLTKRIRDLYLLKLMLEALESVSVSLATAADYIKENVDFSEIEKPTEEATEVLAEIPGAIEGDNSEIA